MKMEQIRQLLEVYRTGSINQAAVNLYISQPNLSLSLRNLEVELGYPLFVRNSRGVCFTTQGENFVEYAKSVLLQFDQLKLLYSEEAEPERDSFSVSNMHFRYVTELAAKLYNQHLQSDPFKMFIWEGDRDECIDQVFRGDTEVGVINVWSRHEKNVMAQMRAKNIRFYPIVGNAPTIVLGPGHPFYCSPADFRIKVETLREFPCVMYKEQDLGVYSNMAEIMGLEKVSAKIVVNSRSVLYEILEHTNAFTITSTNRNAYHRAAYYPNARSFDLENPPDNICTVGWIKRRDYNPSPLTTEFIKLLKFYLTDTDSSAHVEQVLTEEEPDHAERMKHNKGGK